MTLCNDNHISQSGLSFAPFFPTYQPLLRVSVIPGQVVPSPPPSLSKARSHINLLPAESVGGIGPGCPGPWLHTQKHPKPASMGPGTWVSPKTLLCKGPKRHLFAGVFARTQVSVRTHSLWAALGELLSYTFTLKNCRQDLGTQTQQCDAKWG